MPYPAIPSHQIPYDIDGSSLGYTANISDGTETNVLTYPVIGWFDTTQLMNSCNPEWYGNIGVNPDTSDGRGYFIFFTELKEITHFAIKVDANEDRDPQQILLQGSADTTNGNDGTWETPSFSYHYDRSIHQLRSNLPTVSFSGPVKVLRIGVELYYGTELGGFLVYGYKYVGETPDDIVFVDANTGNELTALTDWGDRPEGTTAYKQIKVKNASITKTANNINLQLNHTDFLMSWNAGGPWSAVLDITSLGTGAESATVYIKNELAPPPLPLGPKVARIIATVGSWT